MRFISRDAKNPSYLLIAELTFEIIDMYIEYEATRALKTTTVPFHEPPVFITTLEREQFMKMSSRTITEIKEITDQIECISAVNVRAVFAEAYEQEFIHQKGVLKQEYLEFLMELNDHLENESI